MKPLIKYLAIIVLASIFPANAIAETLESKSFRFILKNLIDNCGLKYEQYFCDITVISTGGIVNIVEPTYSVMGIMLSNRINIRLKMSEMNNIYSECSGLDVYGLLDSLESLSHGSEITELSSSLSSCLNSDSMFGINAKRYFMFSLSDGVSGHIGCWTPQIYSNESCILNFSFPSEEYGWTISPLPRLSLSDIELIIEAIH